MTNRLPSVPICTHQRLFLNYKTKCNLAQPPIKGGKILMVNNALSTESIDAKR